MGVQWRDTIRIMHWIIHIWQMMGTLFTQQQTMNTLIDGMVEIGKMIPPESPLIQHIQRSFKMEKKIDAYFLFDVYF